MNKTEQLGWIAKRDHPQRPLYGERVKHELEIDGERLGILQAVPDEYKDNPAYQNLLADDRLKEASIRCKERWGPGHLVHVEGDKYTWVREPLKDYK